MNRKNILIIILLFLCIGIFIITSRHRDSTAIAVIQPTHGPAVHAVYATGTVEASVMMPLAPRIGARITELLTDEGQPVAKGQILAQMEDTDLQQTIQELQARETFAAAEWARNEKLLASNSVSRAQAQQAKSNWESAKAAASRAKTEATFMQITAPEDGLILRRDGEVGQFIPANQTIFWLSCCAPLRITTEVDEEDIPLVKIGQKALIRADAFEGKVFSGEVQSITPKGDPIARSYRVRVSLPETSPLQIGMTAETNIIITEHENALLLPATAVQKNSVWQITDGKLTLQKIETGAHGLDNTEITSGLSDDALVVLNPNDTLEEGASPRTRLVKANETTTPKP